MDYTAALHGDLAGYSALVADDEIETFQDLQAFRTIIEGAVARHSGQMGDLVGDEFLAVFPDVAGAVTAAVQMQREMALENQRLRDGRKMRFRLGVHTGSIHIDERGWFGDAINIAARLQAKADPGGISVSRAVLDAVEDTGTRIESMGPLRLKNIPEPVHAFRLIDDGLPVEADKPWRRRVTASEVPTLAVLPFTNLGAAEDEFFASGLMMSLIISLMQIPNLDVISESSSFQVAGQTAQDAGRGLGARYVLEGAVQKLGDRVRVMTQLVDTVGGKTTWADRFEAEITDLFEAQDSLVDQIVAALDVGAIAELRGSGSHIYRSQLDRRSVELVYRAWQQLIKGTADGARQAREMFEEVTRRVPDSSIGWSLAGWVHLWEVLKGYATDETASIDRAEEFSTKAEAMGDPSGFSNAVLAYVRLVRGDWDGAYESAVKATVERPSCDVTFGVAASVMRYLGRWQEAIEFADHASHLSPLLNDWYRTILASSYFVGGDYEAAADTAEGVVASDEDEVEALLTLAASQAAMGRSRHAQAAVQQALRTSPSLNAERLREMMPYKDPEILATLVKHLQEAGLQ